MVPVAVAGAVAKPFAEKFYQLFDAIVQDLGNLYEEDSMLTFEGEKFLGKERILSKLQSLPFQQCQHRIKTVNSQTAGPAGGVLILVKGVLDFVRLDGVRQAVDFSQCVGLNDIKCDFSVNIQ
ncbi:nuclear transport factor 2A-like [Syzygium oleosum]|uniref:nuclear transport factor 2A-like n=1 Tax=Syzygium oleosum TaxID=219896 RepID=UPI0024BAD953|nr:nuclear transport factor 2A-like [Syzygium oleosum]